MTVRRASRWLIPLGAFVLVTPPVSAGAGDLDPAFGTGGKVATDFAGGHAAARALTIGADGKIVIAGFAPGDSSSDFALARFHPDGTLDETFGREGKVTTDFAGQSDEAATVAIQPDGAIVAAGFARVDDATDFALARYHTDGSLDETFGTGGRVLTDVAGSDEVAGNDEVADIALQPDGRIVVAGCTTCLTSASDSILARYQPDGTLDETFGDGGRTVTDFAEESDAFAGVALQPDGRIVVAGFAAAFEPRGIGPGSRYTDFSLARYLENGTLDPSFGSEGKVTTDFGEWNDAASDVVLQPDGKTVAAGLAYHSGSIDFGLARYNSDGSLDPTFGAGGTVTTDFGGEGGYVYGSAATGLALQADGAIVAAGLDRGNLNFALARYHPTGILDPTFGSGGKVTTDFAQGEDAAWGVALSPGGGIVAAGLATVEGIGEVALARYGSDLLAAAVR